ncbi:hypothetical protein [Leptospira bouyouniensis]|uniref:hypothetical protein n=1 Tax=Leptospira bouyouniensis TaxID=2484911 RepID=UPI0010917B5D|nr:hypothetical protein [Leptospira bouyouniensis]TGM74772.1 hypothetical protein EHQ99_17510 [Leptospira bouyouniensis]
MLIKIKLSSSKFGSDQKEFWKYIESIKEQFLIQNKNFDYLFNIETPEKNENLLKNYFGLNLRNKFFEKRAIEFQSTFFINLESINYGSLILGLDFTPISSVLEFFNNNFELFESALKNYSIFAFSESVFPTVPMHKNPLLSENFTVTIENSSEIKEIFKLSNKKYKKELNLASEKPKWLWIISNTSLIIPLGLSIYIILKSFYMFGQIEEFRAKNYNEFIKTYLELNNPEKEISK